MSEPLTITAAAPLLRSGELTPTELLEQCLRRIDIYEPAVKAWAYLDRERARQDAARATDEIKDGNYSGALHGIPIGIKDIIDVYDMPTGCGSKLWANSYARQDATCVERLRQAGAIILGKTVTTAYAYLDPPVTRNPWNLGRTPGGSSSGSAAAVACGMCLASLGTQTGGSTIRPASYCGVYALKPTHGRMSVNGVLPLAPSLDHIGVMANCVRDLAMVFEVIAGPTPVHASLVDDGPEKLRLFRLGGFFEMGPDDLLDAYRDALRSLSEGGVDELPIPTGFADIPSAYLTVIATEAAQVHAERMSRRPDDYPPRIRELIETGLSRTAEQYRTASLMQLTNHRQFCKRLDRTSVVATPATPDFAPPTSTTGNPMFNSPWSFLGLPVVSVPCGWSADGLPAAAQFIAASGNEPHLLATAAWAERQFAISRRLPPVPAA